MRQERKVRSLNSGMISRVVRARTNDECRESLVLSLPEKVKMGTTGNAASVFGSSAARAVVQMKSTGSNCAMLDRMKKPELLITQKVGEVPIRGICSACPHIVFDIGSKRGKRGDHERKLKKLFSEHLKKVHAA